MSLAAIKTNLHSLVIPELPQLEASSSVSASAVSAPALLRSSDFDDKDRQSIADIAMGSPSSADESDVNIAEEEELFSFNIPAKLRKDKTLRGNFRS